MNKLLVLSATIFTLLGCNSNSISQSVTVETESKYDTVRNEKVLSGQIVRSFRSSDRKLLAELTKVNNYNDDYKLTLITGFTKKDGLSDFLLDSLFYDKNGNMTLKKSYVKRNGTWVQKQYSQSTYRPDNQIAHFKTERLNEKKTFSKQVFYSYNEQGKLISETEYECSDYHPCDSSFKKQYFYNQNGKQDSTKFFTWSDKNWVFRRTFGKTKNGR